MHEIHAEEPGVSASNGGCTFTPVKGSVESEALPKSLSIRVGSSEGVDIIKYPRHMASILQGRKRWTTFAVLLLAHAWSACQHSPYSVLNMSPLRASMNMFLALFLISPWYIRRIFMTFSS